MHHKTLVSQVQYNQYIPLELSLPETSVVRKAQGDKKENPGFVAAICQLAKPL